MMYETIRIRSVFLLSVVGMGLSLAVSPLRGADPPQPVAHWTFEKCDGRKVVDAIGKLTGVVKGFPQAAPGVVGLALKFDHDFVIVPSSPVLRFADATFSISAWVNPYAPGSGQQMIIAKNVYSAGQREWGLMIDKDNRFRFYLWRGGWKTVGSQTEPRPGHWHHVAVTVEKGFGRLYVNGNLEGEGPLAPSCAPTDAPLTIGGTQEEQHVRQACYGVLDEVAIYRDVLTPAAIQALASTPTTPHKIEVVEPVKLWDGGLLPKTAETPVLEGVTFHVIKRHQPEVDGGNWLLGVALAWHKGRLYASFGFNAGSENTATEEARGRMSNDGGQTWGKMFTIDAGGGNLGVSHGVFLSHKGTLWAFHGAFYDKFQRTHTRAYTLDEATGDWQAKGVVIDAGFWPLQEPLKMADGNWIMAGARVAHGLDVVGSLPAVAVSHGDDFTRWDLVVIPSHTSVPVGSIWGESSVIVDGAKILNVSRWGRPIALASASCDYGRTWTPAQATNLSMAASKPYTGTLSSGQNYLICTTTADSGNRRSPLTIAVSQPGVKSFSRVFVIRHAVFPEGPGPSHANAQLCYPYAVEHDGKLYVGYAVKNHRTAEMAVIPLEKLR